MTIKRQRYHRASRTGVFTAFIFLFFTGTSVNTCAQAWFNNSWSNRKSHVVNSAAGAGTNYQVQVTVNFGSGTDAAGVVFCNGLCKTDFTDIRFTAADGTTLLSHWIQSFTASNNAVFWVKVPGDLTVSNQTIYMYYGNAAATNISSGINTFIYYDDGSVTTGWTTSGTVGSSNVQGNPINSLRANGAVGSYLNRNTGIGPNTFTFFNVFTVTGNLGNFFFECNSAGLGQMYRLDSRGTPNFTGFATTTNWTIWNAAGTTQTSSPNTWYQFGIAINTTGTSSTLYYNPGTGTNPVAGTALGTFATTNSGSFIGLVGDAAGATLFTYWDNIITRKLVSPEPVQAAWGAQELPPLTFSPGVGCAGAAGIVLTGTGFTGATAVSFNGTPAVYIVNSATQITATVPLSATTGTISVTAPAGTAMSLSSFTVNALPVSSVTNQTNITCFAASDGTITVTASGGAGPYTFSVDNGASFLAPTGTNLRLFTGLVANTAYKIKIKDINGCISK